MVTLKEIAEKVGVTTTTVSRAINNRGYVSEETRRKIQDAMKELHYQPNELARSLSKSRTNTIGLIVPHISHPFFAKVISNLENAAAERKYKLLLCNSKEKPEKEEEYLDMFISNRVSGIVICSKYIDISKLRVLDIPIINLERPDETGAITIQCDNYYGGRLAAEHLIKKGCRSLIHFGGIKGKDMPADQRTLAFEQTCAQAGIHSRIYLGDAASYGTMDYHRFIENALVENPQTDGIFASSDLIAAQVIQVCAKLGMSVPEQMKVVGFDDVMISEITTPTITTIHQPVREMTELAVEYINKSLKGMLVPSNTVLPVYLVERASA